MPLLRPRQFDLINFLYGIGALALLLGALFTVLEIPYAREFFGGGILIEVVVFIIMMIDSKPDKSSLSEEIVFPPSSTNELKEEGKITSSKENVNEFDRVIDTIGVLNNSFNEIYNTTKDLAKSVESLERNYQSIAQSNKSYDKRLDDLNKQIAKTNEKLKN